MKVNARNYWMMFLETGAPEIYLLYNEARRMEDSDVLDDPGLSASRHGLQ